MEGKWAWEANGSSDQQPPLVVQDTVTDTDSLVSSIPEKVEKKKEPPGKSLDDVQKMLGSTLLDAFAEEELIQAELNDIREINRREMLKKKPPAPEPKPEPVDFSQ